MRTRWVISLMLLMASGSANSADMVGRASIIDGDTLEIHGSRIRLACGESMRRRAASFVGATEQGKPFTGAGFGKMPGLNRVCDFKKRVIRSCEIVAEFPGS
jgi:hypothetical protein